MSVRLSSENWLIREKLTGHLVISPSLTLKTKFFLLYTANSQSYCGWNFLLGHTNEAAENQG